MYKHNTKKFHTKKSFGQNFLYDEDDIHGKNLIELINQCSMRNIKITGIRNCKYSACIGNIVYFINKLKLKGKDYTMINDDEANSMISSSSRNAPESMLGKIFGYFFNE